MAAGWKLIEDYSTLTPDALAGRVVITPAAYVGKMTGGDPWGNPASDNWNWVAVQFEAINLWLGNPSSHGPRDAAIYILEETADPQQGLGQREFGGEYTLDHVFPGLHCWLLAPALAQRAAEWRDVDAHLLPWLRAWAGWHAAAGTTHKGRKVTAAEAAKIGPRVVVAAGAPTDLDVTALNGERGVVVYKGVSWIFVSEKGQNDVMCYLAHGAGGRSQFMRRMDAAAEILRQKNLYREPTTPEERARMRAASGGDLDALEWCAGLARGFKAPRCRPWIRRYADGSVVQGILVAGGSSTCPAYATLVEPDGTMRVLVADPGYRESGTNNYVRPGTAVVDDAARTVTAQRNDASLPAVTLALPAAELVWKLDTHDDGTIETWRQGAPVVSVPGDPSMPPTEPTPAPIPDGYADGRHWLVNAAADLAAAKLGYFCTISLVEGHPELRVLRKEDGPKPFSTETLWLDDQSGEIRIVCEVGYTDGNVANLRTFWNPDGRPGIRWLPYEIPRDHALTYTTRGQLVETALRDDGAPYLPDGTPRLAAGQWREDKVVASTTLRHVGVVDDFGEPVAVVEREDVMGVEPANVETYWIGFGRGAYGYVWWRSQERRVPKRDEKAERIQLVSSPCRFYSLLPDGSLRWLATPGYSGPLPAGVETSQRPSAAAPQPEGGSSSGGGFLAWLRRLLGL